MQKRLLWKGVHRLVWLKFVLLFAGVINITSIHAQVFKRTAVTGFNVDNGLLQNSITNVVVDKYGFVWFSSPAGIQRYDGSRFETIHPFAKGMIEDKSANLTILTNEELWISHINGITAYDPDTHRFRLIYKKPPANSTLYKYAGEDDTSVWYVAYGEAFLQLSKKKGDVLSKVAFTLIDTIGYPIYCKQVNKNLLSVCMRHSLTIFDMVKKKVLYTHQSKQEINGFLPLDDRTILLLKKGNFYKFDINSGKEYKSGQADDTLSHSTMFPLQLMKNGNILAGHHKNIYEFDTAALKIQTKWAGFNQEYILNSGYISNTYLDRFNQLWVLSNSDGVKKINLDQQPFQYYGTAIRKNNFVRSIYVDKSKGLILAGTYGSGLLMFDTFGNLRTHIPMLIEGKNDVVAIEHLEGDKYLLLTFGPNSFYVFDSKSKKTFPVFIAEKGKRKPTAISASYYASLHKIDKNNFLFANHSVIKFRMSNGEMKDTMTIKGHTPRSSINYLYTQKGEHCFTTEQGLDFFDKDFKVVRSVSILPRIRTRCIAQDDNGNIWLGTETGLYKADANGKIVKKYSKENGLPDEGIYAIQASDRGIYFSHNKGLSFITGEGKFTHYTRHSGLQENEFNTKSTFKAEDGQLYFGGINGITAFVPQNLPASNHKPVVYVTALQVMGKPWKDTAAWNISKMKLPYKENMVGFHIGVPGEVNNAAYNYEYMMEGLEPNWITTSGVDFIRYVLPPGTYTFRARISSANNVISKEARIEITIAAPWWQQWWFRILTAMAAVAVIVYFIHAYNRRKYLRKIKQLEVEHRIQLERERISRDLHDNIGAYASAIVNTVDKVVKNPADSSRLYNLKDNASEIMTNLRDTIWALNKNDISTTRLTDRIKTYLQKMRDTYPHIKIDIHENVDNNVALSPEFALNLLRIVQEGFHNAVKHSNGDRITLVLNINQQVYISIKDNGSGFDHFNKISGGNGFENMRARAKENNVSLKIYSSADKGTTIELFSQLH